MKINNKLIMETIAKLEDIIYNIYIQNYFKASNDFQVIFSLILQIDEYKEEIQDKSTIMYSIMDCVMKALENSDMILLADLLKEALIPHIKSSLIIKDSEKISDYVVEVTSSGYFTLKDMKTEIYLHSNSNPMEEAKHFINNCFEPSKMKYIVWGVGLAYHIYRLVEKSQGAIEIEVYDDKEEIFQLADKYGVLADVKKYITYFYDPDGKKFVHKIKDKKIGIIMHYPSVKTIKNCELKKSMEKLYIGWNGTLQFKHELEINFRRNEKVIDKNVDELLPFFKDKEVFLIAAGPSLDESIELLTNRDGNTKVVTVTTILRKMIDLNIVPDFTVIMDPTNLTLRQIEDLKNQTVPMVIGSTVYWEIANKYKGEKYISYQKDYFLAEEIANSKGKNIYPTGGSVTTLALSILLKAGVKRINLVGADMAYLNELSHASGVKGIKKRDNENLETIKSVTGNIVYTEKKLISYLKWIEREIKKYPEIKVYNYSKTGAWISGTYNPYTEEKYN